MRTLLVAITAVALVGCATPQPQQVVVNLDPQHAKYGTDDCRMARQTALAYDDNVAGRAGAGIALGLLLGPFGIPLAMAMDASQDEKRKAVNTELVKYCGGVPTVMKAAPPPRTACVPGPQAC